ncbi:hypothetical protein ACFYOF_16600 [Streptomyces sp. NPDC007148]|uniref:hypothetical protein n=1 Tax=Streptomyces sp. NPDC007148 TaxID=3364775 RepID=UPI00368DD684
MSQHTVRQIAGATVRYTIICGTAGLVANLAMIPFNDPTAATVAWLDAMVLLSFLLSTLADSVTGRKGGRS